ncbi:MAG TPA: two-component regulator propeller domain-containing protein [Pyrinomonadaceae bacterium]|jgi:signal transduction histidine kinase
MTEELSRKGAKAQRPLASKSLAAFCLLVIAFFFTVPFLLLAQNANQPPARQTETAQATPTVASAPTPTPTPTPTPPSTLHQWGAVTLFHGLPSNRVRAIAQGADGAMWFGTDAGLAKYDGRRTQAVTAEGLSGKRVLALRLDEDGVLWVGTEDGAARGLNGEFQFIKETAGKAVTAIITPERGRALLATEQGVVFDCRTNSDKTLDVRSSPAEPLQSAAVDDPGALKLTSLAMKDGVLYVGTRSRGVLTTTGGVFAEIQSRPRAFFVEAIERDARGRLWYGAKARAEESGLYEAGDDLKPVKVGAGLGTVTALRAGAHDDMWVGTNGRGAFRYDRDERLVERFTFEGTAGGLRSDFVFSIFVDREEVIWFGTDRGVCRYDPHAARVENVSGDAESNFVRVLFETSDGQLLAGTNRGLFVYESAAREWRIIPGLAHSAVFAIAEDKAGRVLAAAADGLYRSDKAGALPVQRVEGGSSEARDNVRGVAEFGGKIYAGTFGRGVERLDRDGRTLIWPTGQAAGDAPERNVVSLQTDRGGRLWIGTALAGAFVYDGREVKQVPALAPLKGSAVWSVADAGNDRLWFASARGLYLYQNGTLKEVAQNLDVRAVLADENSAGAWCATTGGGLLRVVMDDQVGAVVSRLDAEQGLPSQNAFAVIPARDDEGTLLVGTSRGVARYSPGRIPPVLTPVRVIGQKAHQLDELRTGLRLEYPQNSLLFDVAATSSRTYPEQFQYAFLLQDARGRVIKQKFSHDAQFALESLSPGSYRVVARAFSKDLVASEPFAFEFAVAGAPFPWTTVSLSVLLSLALVALWWGYGQNRRLARTGVTLADTNRQLADARLQLANETEAERRRIARDLHDQTLADLRHLLMLTDQLPANGGETSQQRSAPVAPSVFRSEIESISHEIRRICEDLSPSVLENVGFSAALEWALSNAVTHAPPERKFEYEFVADENLEERLSLPRATEMQIYRILQEAVSNISRHAAATRVRLAVKTTGAGEFLLALEDNGRDFDPQDVKVKQGRGLANIRARASLIEAEVNWKRREGGGTEFTLRKAGAVKNSQAH